MIASARVRAAALALGLAGTAVPLVRAQDSQFGIRGLGVPGRWESVRARTTGGAFAPFDPFSPLLEASLADVRRVSASVTGGTSWRSVAFPSVDTSLRGTRFPALVLAGPIGPRLVLSAGFSTYLDKSFGLTRQDTVILRGQPVGVADQITSDGAVTDLRLALAARVHRSLALGVSVHGLTGSTRVTARREFSDTMYLTSIARDEVAYGGIGASASVLFDATSTLRIAAWARNDAKLRADIRGTTVAEDDLPFSYGGGVRLQPGAEVLVATSVVWRKWDGAGPNAHDTFSWSVGAEAGSPGTPVRAGVRGGTLPFGPAGGSAPTEFAITAGLGKQFSGGRGRLDFGLERLQREGGGVTERVWTLLLGLTVRP